MRLVFERNNNPDIVKYDIYKITKNGEQVKINTIDNINKTNPVKIKTSLKLLEQNTKNQYIPKYDLGYNQIIDELGITILYEELPISEEKISFDKNNHCITINDDIPYGSKITGEFYIDAIEVNIDIDDYDSIFVQPLISIDNINVGFHSLLL